MDLLLHEEVCNSLQVTCLLVKTEGTWALGHRAQAYPGRLRTNTYRNQAHVTLLLARSASRAAQKAYPLSSSSSSSSASFSSSSRLRLCSRMSSLGLRIVGPAMLRCVSGAEADDMLNALFCTCPLVPEPRGVKSPIPLYMTPLLLVYAVAWP